MHTATRRLLEEDKGWACFMDDLACSMYGVKMMHCSRTQGWPWKTLMRSHRPSEYAAGGTAGYPLYMEKGPKMRIYKDSKSGRWFTGWLGT